MKQEFNVHENKDAMKEATNYASEKITNGIKLSLAGLQCEIETLIRRAYLAGMQKGYDLYSSDTILSNSSKIGKD